MTVPSVKQQLLNEIENLTPEQQEQVLEYTRSLRPPLPSATPGEELAALVRELDFDPHELAAMEKAIEDCVKIDWDEW